MQRWSAQAIYQINGFFWSIRSLWSVRDTSTGQVDGQLTTTTVYLSLEQQFPVCKWSRSLISLCGVRLDSSRKCHLNQCGGNKVSFILLILLIRKLMDNAQLNASVPHILARICTITVKLHNNNIDAVQCKWIFVITNLSSRNCCKFYHILSNLPLVSCTIDLSHIMPIPFCL